MSKRRVIVVMKDGVVYGVYSSVETLLRAGIVKRIPRTFYSHLKEGCVYKVGDYEIQRFWLNE